MYAPCGFELFLSSLAILRNIEFLRKLTLSGYYCGNHVILRINIFKSRPATKVKKDISLI